MLNPTSSAAKMPPLSKPSPPSTAGNASPPPHLSSSTSTSSSAMTGNSAAWSASTPNSGSTAWKVTPKPCPAANSAAAGIATPRPSPGSSAARTISSDPRSSPARNCAACRPSVPPTRPRNPLSQKPFARKLASFRNLTQPAPSPQIPPYAGMWRIPTKESKMSEYTSTHSSYTVVYRQRYEEIRQVRSTHRGGRGDFGLARLHRRQGFPDHHDE